ncbi:MAG: pyrroline-5-carboxylate reductase [Gammaproteobacteria bacterium]|nr:MAG: pyrroline-5-carboxylate reductase [Gammaproteobacteria bacterium]
MTKQTIGLIGAGNMARSLAGGLLQNGWDPGQIVLSDPDPQQCQAVEQSLKVRCFANNADVAAKADVLVLAIKPQAAADAATDIAKELQAMAKKPLLLSVIAGIRIPTLEHWLGNDFAIVRAMPNTAALVGSGAAALFANKQTSEKQRNLAESIMRAVGIVVWLDDEALMDSATALSGSGPAYFFLVMEAMEQAAIKQGLDADTARLLTLETAYGAARMALEGHEDPAALRQQVTSPGGTTEAAIKVFIESGIFETYQRALDAASSRSRKLADLFAGDKS